MTTATKYLRHCLEQCDLAGVKLNLLTKSKSQVNLGYFDDAQPQIMVHAAHPGWLTTLAHEMGHMAQWRDGSPYWTRIQSGDYELFEDWLVGRRRLSPRAVLAIVRRLQKVELDAERRAIKDVRRYGLGDVEQYIQGANYYVWQYEAARRWKQWPTRTPDLQIKMPKRLISMRQLGALPVDFGRP